MSRETVCSLLVLSLAWGVAPPVAAAVDGLIVQLRGAPAHADRSRAQALAAPASGQRLEGEARRWQQVLAAAPQPAGTPGLRPQAVGSAAFLLRTAQPLTAEQADEWAGRLRAQPDVAWVAANLREQRLQSTTPDDPMFASGSHSQWWLQPAAGADDLPLAARRRGVAGFAQAWQRSTGAPAQAAARVAVLDTGITAHPELAGHLLPGHDFVSDAAAANDGNGRDADATDPGDWIDEADRARSLFRDCEVARSSWHGTMTAGMLAAGTHNATGVAAIHWDGRVLPVRVAGKCGAAVADIIDGMRWAAGLPVPGVPANPYPARIISLSFGGPGACNPAYQQAVDELRAAGALLVAAGGNGHGALTRPANCPGVLGVVALNRDGFKTTYSNFGPQAAIATVGGDTTDGAWGAVLSDGGLLSIYNDGAAGPGNSGYAYLFGSSFAAPGVAGALSLMLSVHPSMTVAQLEAGLRSSARPHVQSAWMGACGDANPGRCVCSTATCGAGILDADGALAHAQALAAGREPPPRPDTVPARLDGAELRQAAALGPDRAANVVPQPISPAAPVPDGGDPDGANGGQGGSGGGGALTSTAPLAALALASALLLRRKRKR